MPSKTHPVAGGLEELRFVGGSIPIESRARTSPRVAWGPWEPRSKRSLLAYAVDSAEWAWLKEHGLRRPSPSRSRKERGEDVVEVRLTPEAAKALDRAVPKHGSRQAAALAAILAYDHG